MRRRPSRSCARAFLHEAASSVTIADTSISMTARRTRASAAGSPDAMRPVAECDIVMQLCRADGSVRRTEYSRFRETRLTASTACVHLPIISCQYICARIILQFGLYVPGAQRPALPEGRRLLWIQPLVHRMDFYPRSRRTTYELIRPYLRSADLSQDMVLVEVDETLKRAYLPHRGVISLVVKLARGEHVEDRDGRPRQHLRRVLGARRRRRAEHRRGAGTGRAPRRSTSTSFVSPPTRARRCAPRWYAMASRSTRRSSRPPAATPRTRWSPGWRDACCTRATSPAATSSC